MRARLILLLFLLGCPAAEVPPDLYVSGGTIHLDVETATDALAIREGRVIAVGADATALAEDAVERLDLAGGTVTPGLIDAHMHILAGSFILDRVVLTGASSEGSIGGLVGNYIDDHPDEDWIVGYGWVYSLFDEDPTKDFLDVIAPSKPVLLGEASGHIALVNSEALARAGITADTPDPEGGTIVRDPATGEPTGLLLEEALALVADVALSDFTDDDLGGGLRGTFDDMIAAGLTGAAEIMASPGFTLARPWIYEDLDQRGLLPVRLHYYVPIFEVADLTAAADLVGRHDTERLRFAGGKLWVDGTIGAATAWTHEPSELEPDNYGLHYFDEAQLEALFVEAERLQIPLKLHVNGDAAVTAALDAAETVLLQGGGLTVPLVFEHTALVRPEDMARMADLGIVASVQPINYTLNRFGDVTDHWGDRFDRAFDFKGFHDAGVTLALGTDWPVWPFPAAPPNLSAAVVSRGERAISMAEALRAYTAGAARSVGAEADLGQLHPGFLADFVVWDADPLAVEASAITDLRPLSLWVGGEQTR
jgi:predicted amidohydrolase YtcJ